MIHLAIKNNINLSAIILFILLYGLVIYYKIPFMYHPDGTLKMFGIGFITRSVLPAWLISVIFAILSYFIVIYYVSYPTIQF